MTRRSQRIKGKVVTYTEAQDVVVSDAADTDGEFQNDDGKGENEEERPRKKAKRGTRSKGSSTDGDYRAASSSKKRRIPEQFRKVRGRLGLLERLAKDVPLEVILEIFCYLDPGDLLRLARTTKDLRGILMSQSSESVWRTAREGVEDLPPRPDDLNEPQYAHLLYESYCHICGHKPCDSVFWSFRVRCCKSCASATFTECDDPDFVTGLPREYSMRRRDVLPWEYLKGSWRYRDVVCHTGITARYQAEFEALETETERNEWIERKIDERRKRVEHANLCQRWLQARLDRRSNELDDIREQRREAILERLEKIGWREEAELSMTSFWLSDDFASHKLVRQPKKLTDYGWNSIKTELVEWLTRRKEERLERQRRNTLDRRYKLLSAEYDQSKSRHDLHDPFPSKGDILTSKYFEDLIWDTPLDEEITAEFIKSEFLEHFPLIVDQWRPAKTQELVQVMQTIRPGASVSDLHLATTVFECTKCLPRTLMHYPQMFYHHCCFENRETNSARMAEFQYIFSNPWSSKSLILSGHGAQAAKEIVEACSLDHTTATIQDLYNANPLIECKTCHLNGSSWYGGRLFMRWPSAISSDHRTHTLSINDFGDETQQILASERSDNLFFSACCAYCHDPIMKDLLRLQEHLRLRHNDILNWGADDCIFPLSLAEARTHFYWNPTVELRRLCATFRYNKDSAQTAPSVYYASSLNFLRGSMLLSSDDEYDESD
ncbi:hypothetical protein GYMLUDRAFT_683468 [Collybiopsis luxurians FD-317 M1]|uniref:Unplaced genomic scaffold GYMLUscaffold_33, whole genome shotgun sequence n=1 Tax=Collybiopsis luxurians FD-317 M1 TaxID=944289 RepID=A0A0D0C9I0_9AGAR|nr:hypothetical protein GYMLUDRAFT_683468 [Collybiopsis luxurians FD-317 M1]